MSKIKQSKIVTIPWNGHEEQNVTPAEFILKINELLEEPLDNLMQMDGDMYLSDYRKLMDAKWRMNNAVRDLKKGDVAI